MKISQTQLFTTYMQALMIIQEYGLTGNSLFLLMSILTANLTTEADNETTSKNFEDNLKLYCEAAGLSVDRKQVSAMVSYLANNITALNMKLLKSVEDLVNTQYPHLKDKETSAIITNCTGDIIVNDNVHNLEEGMKSVMEHNKGLE